MSQTFHSKLKVNCTVVLSKVLHIPQSQSMQYLFSSVLKSDEAKWSSIRCQN